MSPRGPRFWATCTCICQDAIGYSSTLGSRLLWIENHAPCNNQLNIFFKDVGAVWLEDCHEEVYCRKDQEGRIKAERAEWESGELSGKFMEWNTVENGHQYRNRHKNWIKRNGQARLVSVKDINRNVPTTWRWARGDTPARPLPCLHRLQEGPRQGLARSFVGNHEEVQHQRQPSPSQRKPLWQDH